MTAIEHAPAGTVAVAHPASSSTASGAARRRSFRSRPVWHEVLLPAVVYGLYTFTRAISAGGANEAVANANRVLRAEHIVGLSPPRWLNDAVSTRAFLATPADYAYATLHYAVTLAVLISRQSGASSGCATERHSAALITRVSRAPPAINRSHQPQGCDSVRVRVRHAVPVAETQGASLPIGLSQGSSR